MTSAIHRRRSGALALFTLLLLIVGPAVAAAQTVSSPLTLGGAVGGGRTWDDEGQIGDGGMLGAYAAWRWRSRTAVDVATDLQWHRRTGGAFEARGHTSLVSAALVQAFGGASTSGFVLGGGAVGFHAGTAGFPAHGMMRRISGSARGFVAGGGLTFRSRRGLDVGPIARMVFLSPEHGSDPAYAITVALRVGIRR